MPKVIEVVYENGVFKPLEKVNLKEGEKVKVILNLDPVELARRYSGVGKYSRNLNSEKLNSIEADML